MTDSTRTGSVSWKLIVAFASVYLIWGSTYLAIHFAIESMPPLLMLGARFGVAGLILYGWLRMRGSARPTIGEWRSGWIVGTLTLAVGTGSVAWAEQSVPSGVAALIVTTVPIWMVLLQWKWKGGQRPNAFVFTGLGLGIVGIILLVDPRELLGSVSGSSLGIFVILVGALSWSIGSLQSRDMALPRNPAMSTALQMTMGGISLVLAGMLTGEGRGLDVGAFLLTSWLAWSYLVVFGSLVAFSAYVWLMHHASPGQVSTYAYVNPVVAVFLGWLLANEQIDTRMIAAVFVLVSAVILISRFGRRPTRGGFGRTISGWLGIGVWSKAMESRKNSMRDQFRSSITDRTRNRARSCRVTPERVD